MKLVILLVTIFSIISAQANPHEEEKIYTTLEEVIDATFDHEFESLADRITPQSLKLFREVMQVRFELILKHSNLEEVLDLIGLDSTPSESPLSDKALFIKLAKRAKELDANFVGSEKLLPLDILGTVFAKNGTAHVVYEYSGRMSSDVSSVGYRQSRNLTFKKIGEHWYVHSACFAKTIPSVWMIELLSRQKQTKSDEQDATPNR